VRIRKSTQIRIAVLEAVVVFYALAAGAAHSDSTTELSNPAFLLRLLIPTGIVSIVLLVRNGFGARVLSSPFVDLALALPAATVLPHYQFTKSAVLGWMFLAALRAWFPHRAKAIRKLELQTPITLEKLRWSAMEFEIKAREWNSRGNIAVVAAIGLLLMTFPFTTSFRAQVASLLVVVGALYVAWIIRKRRTPKAVPLGGAWRDYAHYYESELKRQSVLLHRMWHFYFGALIPSMLLLLQGSTMYASFGAVYVLLLGELNYRAIQWIEVQCLRLEHSTLDSDNPAALMSKRPSIYEENGRL
jgi:hypothetical protein